MSAPVFGLVLAGGRSTRMAQDKAALVYHGRPQLEWAMELIAPFVDRAFASVRVDQAGDPVRAPYSQILDTREGLGPIAGILAAQDAHPDVAWLVLACDLPFLEPATVQRLLAAREPGRSATAYRSSHDGLPEPLCAIYEPAAKGTIAAYVASGASCPRRYLIGADAHLVDLPDGRALDNVNTSAERACAIELLSPTERTVTVRYFALLREEAGCLQESVTTTAGTPQSLYAELRIRHRLSYLPSVLRVAVNTAFAEWTRPLADGDEVAFIPPVAGG